MVNLKTAGNAGSLHSQDHPVASPRAGIRRKRFGIKSLSFILTFCLLLLTFSYAQEGGLPGGLLNYGLSPRTIALGKAFTGLADDQEAIYYNPAGLTQLLTHSIKISGLSLYGAELNYLGYGMPTRKFGVLSLSLINLSSGGIDSRDSLMAQYPTFGFTQNCFVLTYALQPLRPISLGANLKLVTSKIAQYSALGMGGDVGLFLVPHQILSLGIAVQNILGPKLTHHDETQDFPLTVRAGSALKLYQGKAVLAFDLVKNFLSNTSFEPHLGLEFIALKNLIMRSGMDKNCLNVGLGIKNDWDKFSFGLDYAVEFHYGSSYLLPPRHKIGLVINWGGFRTWVDAHPKQFSPSPMRKDNVAKLDLHYSTKRPIERWQILIKNHYGEIVRTYSGWKAPPLRLFWDGLDDIGRLVPDGKYYYEIIIVDSMAEILSFGDLLTEIRTLGPEGEIEFMPQE